MNKRFFATVLLLVALVAPAGSAMAGQVAVLYARGVPQVEFAAQEIREALETRRDTFVAGTLDELPRASQPTRIAIAAGREESRRLAESLGVVPLGKDAAEQSYAIRKQSLGGRTTYAVLGADAAGAMYAGLDVAEAIRLGTLEEIDPRPHSPFIARRGIKFNIPLDARTPSYSDAGDAAQQNIIEMWSMDFWREFLDEMARQRFNVLSLWNLHPFPSLVKVPEYPDVALADVMRTTAKFDSTYSLSGHDMVRKTTLANLQTLKKMTIEEKTRFWREVMQYAHDRGIEVYLFTWNIFTWGAEGKYGVTSDQANPVTIDYFRKSVRQTLLDYPLLAGFGVTAGENMQNLKGEFSNERWLWKTYGEGIRDVKRLQPDRRIRLIHRFHQTDLKSILAEWKDYPDTFDFSYKYSVAHMYSSPTPPFAKETLAALPLGQRTWMTVRNDDIYSFRWGDPEYARAYLRALPGPDKLAGYYMGPDGYIWGREFLSTEPDAPRQLVMKKQWYSFMLWGRLSYEPSLPDDLFLRTLAARFPAAPADKLFAASSAASKIIPQATRFFWGDIDLKWFPEACLSHPQHKGFYTVKHFMDGETMPASGIVNIRTYCDRLANKEPPGGITPPEVADALKQHAATTLRLVGEMSGPIAGKELRLTLGDFAAMAHLGNYYAEKIVGATDLARFDRDGQPERQASAVKHLEAALGHWQRYAAVATKQYRPQLLTRIGYVDLNALTEKVRQDVQIARDWKPRGK
ncbi:MAG: hypothetical protein ACYC35_21045 [Pirellulales bacterium]